MSCRLLGNEEGPTPNLLGQILSNPPDCTLSFNGLLPDEEGNFLCDKIQVPHVACLVDSPNKFLSLIQTRLNIITCIDGAWTEFFRDLHPGEALFLPHAVDREFSGDLTANRPYDVVFLGTCLDIEECRKSWDERFSPGLCNVLDLAVEIALSDQTTSYLHAFTQAMNERARTHGDVDASALDFGDVLDNLEFYIRGKDRLDLLYSIRDVKVDIFGVKSGSHGWEKYLKGRPSNLVFHGRASYPEALQIIKQSRLVINSCPSIKWGAHERIFAGYMAGASILTNDNPYIRTLFNADEEILLYRHKSYDEVNDKIVKLLSDEETRRAKVRQAQEKVLANHTWDHRASTLLGYLDKVLPTVYQD